MSTRPLEQHPGPTPVPTTLAGLVERAAALAAAGRRVLLGVSGAPGAGKTTVATQLVESLGPARAVLVPMDGFHLSNATLVDWGRRSRKGAWDTFDADGYLHLLARLRNNDEAVVHAPDFDRDVDESIGSAIPVRAEIPLVITEGNYLLSQEGVWGRVAALLDESWYLDVADDTRQERLARRHARHGMSEEQAAAWARGTDQTNARLVGRGRDRATVVVRLSPEGQTPLPRH